MVSLESFQSLLGSIEVGWAFLLGWPDRISSLIDGRPVLSSIVFGLVGLLSSFSCVLVRDGSQWAELREEFEIIRIGRSFLEEARDQCSVVDC